MQAARYALVVGIKMSIQKIVHILCYKEQNASGKILLDIFYNEILRETKIF